MWITRDELYDIVSLWQEKPERALAYWCAFSVPLRLPKTSFPELTWEDEPIEVTLEKVNER